jgi:ankyrin repeat protein
MRAIATGADVNTTWISGEIDTLKTPLHLACEGDYILCIEILCQAGATVDQMDFDGNTPISIAKKHNKSQIIEILQYHKR